MSFARMFKPAPFVSGTLENGRLVLVRSNGSRATCGVLICHGTLTDNGDDTFTLTFPE